MLRKGPLMAKWSKMIFIAALVCYGIGFSALVLVLSSDHAVFQRLFIAGISAGVFLNLIAVTMRQRCRSQH